MNYTPFFVMTGVGTVFALLWISIYLKYNSAFDDIISAIDPEKFKMAELYFIGFGFIDMFHINMTGERARKKKREIAEVYGEKYQDFYYMLIIGGGLTYTLTLMPVACFFGAISANLKTGMLFILLAIVLLFYMSGEVNKNATERREDILNDLPQVLSKFTLLINAGLIVMDAWEKVAYGGDGPIYKEMQATVIDMQNGMPIPVAIMNFAERCNVKEVRKFAGSVVQNMEKGGGELSAALRELTSVSWEDKRSRIKIQAAGINSKLMIPSAFIFLAIMLIVLAPALLSMTTMF